MVWARYISRHYLKLAAVDDEQPVRATPSMPAWRGLVEKAPSKQSGQRRFEHAAVGLWSTTAVRYVRDGFHLSGKIAIFNDFISFRTLISVRKDQNRRLQVHHHQIDGVEHKLADLNWTMSTTSCPTGIVQAVVQRSCKTASSRLANYRSTSIA